MLSGLTPVERGVWVFETLPIHAVLTFFSGSSLETVHTMSLAHEQLGLEEPFDVCFINNQLNETYSPTTLPYVTWAQERGPAHGYRLHIAQGAHSEAELRAKYPLWDDPGSEDSVRAKEDNKLQPFREALQGKVLWINGARRIDQPSRAHIPILDEQDGRYVLAILADATEPDTLPSNRAHFDLFKMLDEKKKECGLLPYK